MNAKKKSWIFILALCLVFQNVSLAEETQEAQGPQFEGSITPAPLQYAFVEGDQNKFREVNWAQEGYDGGFEDFELIEKNIPGEITASVDGHAMIRNNDYEVNALVEKQNLGYVKLEYQEFSKYYDDMGGTYYPFTALSVNSLGKELELEIGRLRVETGLRVEGYPHLTIAYERHWKDGDKSRLTWTTVTSGTMPTRNIGPSFQGIEEVVDSFEIEESHTIKGFELKGQQTFEWSSAELNREEASLSNAAAASGRKIRVQLQDTRYHLFSTTESAERWFRDETVYTGTAYHYMRLANDEVENIFEMDEFRNVKNFSNPKQVRDAIASNEYQNHAWTGNVMFSPLTWLNIDTKLKTELIDRSGNSSYPQDTTPAAAGGSNPDGIINNIELSRAEDRVARIGEGISFRITGIPKTAIYNEFEFEQMRNWLSEDRDSQRGQSAPAAGEIFGRETLIYMSRGIWTLGAQVVPFEWLNWTAHFRLNRANSDYEDKRETGDTASGAKSAFMDAINVGTQEIATRMSFKVTPWLKPALRYKHQIREYDTRVENLENVESTMASDIFTFEVALQPLHNLLLVGGVSPQYAYTVTPARQSPAANTPRFQANVITWLFNMNYDINDKFGLLGAFYYTHADNFEDNTAAGLPLGAAFDETNLTAGLSWKLSRMVTLITEYGFMRYDGRDEVDGASYNAQLISMRTKINWG